MAGNQSGSVLERTVLKSGQLFLVADRGGDIKALNAEGHGLYFKDMRHLSLFEMDLSGTRLTLLSATGELNSMSELQFTNEALLGPTGEVIAEPRTVSIKRARFLHEGLHERLELFNYNPHALTLTIRFTCGSDFRDMFDVRGFEVPDTTSTGEVEPIETPPEGIILGYHTKSGVRRRTVIVFEPPPEHIEIVNARLRPVVRKEGPNLDQRDEGLIVPPIAAAVFQLELPPMSGRTVAISATPTVETPAEQTSPTIYQRPHTNGALDVAVSELRDSYAEWCAAATQIHTNHQLFDQFLNRALLDLHLLVERYQDDLVPTAGIPWFAVPFGRDSLITSMQTLSVQPSLARGTLNFLARHQGTKIDPIRGEEPGKILHEVRPGETGGISGSLYYASTDSTPLFIATLGEYVTWTGDLELARQLLPNAEAGLAWMDDYGDIDGDGLLESDRYPAGRLGSQGWKDSPDSVTHRDGILAPAPHALAEIQAYRFAAHRHMARLYAALGDSHNAQLQQSLAERTRALFLEQLAMVDADAPFFAMGLDANKQRIETITTNPGHALWAELLQGEPARVATRRLMAEDMLSGWGLRTLSSRARNYNPMSYHNGSVWPHDTSLIALGMKRAGEDAAACRLASEVLEAALEFPGARLPELWCGFPRMWRHQSTPAQYPVGCSPQAWAAGSAFMLLQTLLGLEVDALAGTLSLRPTFPSWLEEVHVSGMRVAGEVVSFELRREHEGMRLAQADCGRLRLQMA